MAGSTKTAPGGVALPAPPAMTDLANAVAAQGAAPPVESSPALSGGLALQIVNPDTLADAQGSYGLAMMASKRRLLNGQASPLTPWDGQLEALVRFVVVLTEELWCV